MRNRQSVEKMVLAALMTALVAVITIIIAIPVPFTNGYIHFGDSIIFLTVLVLGWKYAAVAAGIGSALADILLGYVFWTPWTLVIKGTMALIAGIIIEKSSEIRYNQLITCGALAVLWIVFNLAVQAVVNYVAAHDPTGLEVAVEYGVSEFGVVMLNMQRQLMVFALLIPAGLLTVSLVLYKKERVVVPLSQILGLTGGGLFMIFGYFIAGGVIMGNFAVAAFSIPSNIVQFVVGFFIAIVLETALSKTPARRYFLKPRNPGN